MTDQCTEDVAIPANLAEPLRRAASGVRGGPPDLTEIHQRRRHGQLRRSMVALAGVVVLVTASIVTPRLLTGSAVPVESAAPAVTAEPTPLPAQRMLLSSFGYVRAPAGTTSMPTSPNPDLPNYGYPPGTVGIISFGHWEATASGEVVALDIPGQDHHGVLPRDGGGFVTLEWLSLSDVPRRDGPCITDAALYLRVYEADGARSLSRDVRVRCEETLLVDANETEVFLVRVPHDERDQAPLPGRRLVAHRLADGTERTVADLDAFDTNLLGAHLEADIDGGWLVAMASDTGCRVEVLDVTSGVVRTLTLADLIDDCRHLQRVRPSPSGNLLAVTYATGSGEEAYDVGFAVVDLTGPTLRRREVVASVPAVDADHGALHVAATTGGVGRSFPATYAAGLAWTNDATVRVAWVRTPADLDRVVSIEEILDLQTYSLP